MYNGRLAGCLILSLLLTTLSLAFAEADASILLCVLIALFSAAMLLVRAVLNTGRRRVATVLALAVYGLVQTLLQMHYMLTRDPVRWAVLSGVYRARVLAQPVPANGQFRHVEWDGWGFAGADTTVGRKGKRLLDSALPNDETKLRALVGRLKEHGQILLVVDQPATVGALPVAVGRAEGVLVAYLPGLAARVGKTWATEILQALSEQTVVVLGTQPPASFCRAWRNSLRRCVSNAMRSRRKLSGLCSLTLLIRS
jgi:Transposase